MFSRLFGICSQATKNSLAFQRFPYLPPLVFPCNIDNRKFHSNNNFGGFNRSGKFGGGDRFRNPSTTQFNGSQNVGENLQTPQWSEISLSEFKKDFYVPQEITNSRSDEEVAQFRQEYNMTVSQDAPKPIITFDELQVPEQLLSTIKRKNFTKVSPIQAQGWPIALSGSDMVGIAQTGSGKTLGFMLPALVHIMNQPRVNAQTGPIALVMAPTRELAQQIQQVAFDFGGPLNIRSVCLFGGVSKIPQVNAIRNGVDIVIATPGRLLDLLSMGEVSLQRCTYLVLDEADRMLDMGFEPQIRKVISQIRPDRQTLMWSATWPTEVRKLAYDFLGKYVHLTVGSLELAANKNIKQIVRVCQEVDKQEELRNYLASIYENGDPGKILIFAQTKRTVSYLANFVRSCNVKCGELHGDRSQAQRDQVIQGFRNNSIRVVVATDVAARGLDVDGIQYVINYDFPQEAENYVHRIGRTGRKDNKGTSFTLFTEQNANAAKDLIKILQEADQEVSSALSLLSKTSSTMRSGSKQQNRFGFHNRTGYGSRSNFTTGQKTRYSN